MLKRPIDGEEQISFSQELLRKGTHMGALAIPSSYYFFDLSKLEMLSVMIPAALLMLIIDISRLRNWVFWNSFGKKIGGGMVRSHELAGDFTGAVYILISVCCTVALFSKPIAVASLAFIIVGDTFAALIGRRYGKHRFGRKSVEGSIGCLLGCLIVSFITPELIISVTIVGAVVATVTEALSIRVDDNISVTLVSGLVMTLLERII